MVYDTLTLQRIYCEDILVSPRYAGITLWTKAGMLSVSQAIDSNGKDVTFLFDRNNTVVHTHSGLDSSYVIVVKLTTPITQLITPLYKGAENTQSMPISTTVIAGTGIGVGSYFSARQCVGWRRFKSWVGAFTHETYYDAYWSTTEIMDLSVFTKSDMLSTFQPYGAFGLFYRRNPNYGRVYGHVFSKQAVSTGRWAVAYRIPMGLTVWTDSFGIVNGGDVENVSASSTQATSSYVKNGMYINENVPTPTSTVNVSIQQRIDGVNSLANTTQIRNTAGLPNRNYMSRSGVNYPDGFITVYMAVDADARELYFGDKETGKYFVWNYPASWPSVKLYWSCANPNTPSLPAQQSWINYMPFCGQDIPDQPSWLAGFSYGWGYDGGWIPGADSKPLNNPSLLYSPKDQIPVGLPVVSDFPIQIIKTAGFKELTENIVDADKHSKMVITQKHLRIMTQFIGVGVAEIRLECEDNANKAISGVLYVTNIGQMRVEQSIVVQDSTQPITVSNLLDSGSYVYSFMPDDAAYKGVSTGNFIV